MSRASPPPTDSRLRIDKWLWAARFFKTRALAQEAVEAGRVKLNGDRVKPGREVRLGDELAIQAGDLTWIVAVRGLSDKRGPAPVARQLYEESAESQAARAEKMAARPWQADPGSALKGRPTKRDRRLIHRFSEGK